MSESYNEQTLTILVRDMKDRFEKFESRMESRIDHLEKSIFKVSSDSEQQQAIIRRLMEEDEKQKKVCHEIHIKNQNSILVWIKNNESLVKKIIYGFALLIALLRVSQDQLVNLIKIIFKEI